MYARPFISLGVKIFSSLSGSNLYLKIRRGSGAGAKSFSAQIGVASSGSQLVPSETFPEAEIAAYLKAAANWYAFGASFRPQRLRISENKFSIQS